MNLKASLPVLLVATPGIFNGAKANRASDQSSSLAMYYRHQEEEEFSNVRLQTKSSIEVIRTTTNLRGGSSTHDGSNDAAINIARGLYPRPEDALPPKVTLCKHSNCKNGTYETRQNGVFNNMDGTGIGNDQLTVAKTEAGKFLELWEHTNLRGRPIPLGSYTDDQAFSCAGLGCNDEVSSFKIRDIPNNKKVTLCTTTHPFCSNGEKFVAGIGLYYSMPDTIGNDNIASIKLPEGWKMYMYGDANFEGWTSTSTYTGVGGNDELKMLSTTQKTMRSFIISME